MVEYRWHPLHGRRVRLQYREKRASGDFVHVETEPGNVIALPAWMLDAVVCGQMHLGDPRLELQALGELSRLLLSLGFRSSSQRDVVVAREDAHEAEDPSQRPSRAMEWDPPLLGGLTTRDRVQVVSLLAQLLLEASGLDDEEGGHEDD